jgi:hypothetical protein
MEGSSSAYPQTIIPELFGKERQRSKESPAHRKIMESNRDDWLRSAADDDGLGFPDHRIAEVIDEIDSHEERGVAEKSSPPKNKKTHKRNKLTARELATLETGLEEKDLDIPQNERPKRLKQSEEHVYGEELPLPEGWTPTVIPRDIGSLKKKKKKKSKKPKKKKSKKPKKKKSKKPKKK